MACATLKRSQNFDILDTASSKRRKYGTCVRACSPVLDDEPSPFVPTAPITQIQLKHRIKEEIKRMQRRRLIPRFLGTPAPTTQTTFKSNLSVDNVGIATCSGSLRSLALRSPKRDCQDSDSDTSTSSSSPRSSKEPKLTPSFQHHTTSSPLVLSSYPQPTPTIPTTHNLDTVPIFTLPQVTALCDRLVKEREDELREEYDIILSCKLAEQYEAFLKFNHDQLCSRFQNTPMSYVS